MLWENRPRGPVWAKRMYTSSQGKLSKGHDMARIKLFLSISLILFSEIAYSGIIESVDVSINGEIYTTFRDTISNYTWFDLDNFGSPSDSINSVITDLQGSTFTIATKSQLVGLVDSIGTQNEFGSSFLELSMIMGGNYIGNSQYASDRNLLWGAYDDEGLDSKYGYAYLLPDSGLTLLADSVGYNRILVDYNGTFHDLSVWIVSTAPIDIPEPPTLFLLGLGLIGLRLNRRRSINGA